MIDAVKDVLVTALVCGTLLWALRMSIAAWRLQFDAEVQSALAQISGRLAQMIGDDERPSDEWLKRQADALKKIREERGEKGSEL